MSRGEVEALIEAQPVGELRTWEHGRLSAEGNSAEPER